MRPAGFLVFSFLRLLALATLVLGAPVRADEVSDVQALLRLGKSGEALASADAYLATHPRDPQMRFARSVALREGGRTGEALETLRRLVEDFPELPEPYNNLGVIYAAQGDFDRAREALESAVRNNPGYAIAYENLGDVLARLAERAYARADERGAASAGPKRAALHTLLDASSRANSPPAARP